MSVAPRRSKGKSRKLHRIRHGMPWPHGRSGASRPRGMRTDVCRAKKVERKVAKATPYPAWDAMAPWSVWRVTATRYENGCLSRQEGADGSCSAGSVPLECVHAGLPAASWLSHAPPGSYMEATHNTYFAPCPRGLELVLRDELLALGAEGPCVTPGGVSFSGPLVLCYRANLESRVASRILWRVAQAPYRSEQDVYRVAVALPWDRWFSPKQTIK